MSARLGLRVTGFLILCLLSACTARLPPSAGDNTEERTVFVVEGKFSLTVQDNRLGAQHLSTRFSWHETTQMSQIDLLNPLGITVARLRVTPGGSAWETAQSIETAPDPETLLARRLGTPLPVLGLRYWLRGLSQTGAQRAPQSFDEENWHISYSESPDEEGALTTENKLPREINMRRSLPDGHIKVRFLISDWR